MAAALAPSAVLLSAQVRAGDVRASELTAAALSRAGETEPRINAFCFIDGEGAAATASDIEPGDPRPFAGVPVAVKDLAPVAGLPLTMGSKLLGDFRPDGDAHVVRRLREAGFVILGMTNTPEFGILPVTEPARHGPTRNPWNLERTPGGSSGGSAAAVAAGVVPVAIGSDGGGSVRSPAACCGVVGLKPGRHRISLGAGAGDSFLATQGVIAGTVADAAAMLDVIAGYEPGDPSWAPPPREPFAEGMVRDPGSLRIGVVTASPYGTDVEPACAHPATAAAERLAGLGHRVEEISPPWEAEHLMPSFTTVYCAMITAGVAFGGRLAGCEPAPADVEPLTWAIYERGRGLSALDHMAEIHRLQAYGRELVTFLDGWDIVLTPALGMRPPGIGWTDAFSDDPWAEFAKGFEFTPFTSPWNVTGQPAITVPWSLGPGGMPTSVQLVGPPAGEGLLLAAAAQLEEASPWPGHRRPPL